MSRAEKIFYFIIILMVVMANPPVMIWVNNLARKVPLLFGFPTFWVWLEFWYTLGVVAFAVAAWKIDKWNRDL